MRSILNAAIFRLFSTRNFSKNARPALTTDRYNFERGPYAKLTETDIKFFRSILTEPSMVLENEDDIAFYNVDWLHIFRGKILLEQLFCNALNCFNFILGGSQLVLRPKSTGQVSKILEYCNSKKLAVVPQGGNTGLVGGSVPVFDEIVLSTQLMNEIINLDSPSGK